MLMSIASEAKLKIAPERIFAETKVDPRELGFGLPRRKTFHEGKNNCLANHLQHALMVHFRAFRETLAPPLTAAISGRVVVHFQSTTMTLRIEKDSSLCSE
jgi:hypothetical protein